MGTVPVCSFATRTAQKYIIVFVNMLWHKVLSFLLCNMIEGIITQGTAGEGIEASFKGNSRENLSDLFLNELAFD